ncbi:MULTISPECIES: hydroxymethylbilane synthase [Metallosphaera]|uniref:hydroxymethylbilane synthase n=1 Tax=Metallosphaera TaxID=41980 RepID=UPI001F067DC7|nr:hydroxymethylbilane synthase [Metallosphaera sedula]MCH1770976.1 hydroxymethylbilane synthase [Metallosphaera sedula]MCP6729333.1 hydroxymethylbilane synthase [Metallosphaera sedula]
MKIRIAARGSKLSLKQVEIVTTYLQAKGYETEFIEIKTRADLFGNKPLHEIGKGVFEKEVNEAVLQGRADIAVHSMKDMSSELPPGLELLATPKRENPVDVLVSELNLEELPERSRIGTGSLRRANFLKVVRPDLVVENIRGNVDTRLRKYRDHEYDGIILAEAGLRRLGVEVKRFPLDVEGFTPEPNQGIIAVVGSPKFLDLFQDLNDAGTMKEALAEKETVKVVGGGCHSPLGVLFRLEDDVLHGIASYSNGVKRVTVKLSTRESPQIAGNQLGKALVKAMKDEGLIP